MRFLFVALILAVVSNDCFPQIPYPTRPNISGRVLVWGRDMEGQFNVPASAYSQVVSVAGGSGLSAALKNDGSIVVWGAYSNIPLEVGGLPFSTATDSAVVKIFRESMGLLSVNGELKILGTWGYVQPLVISNVVDFGVSDNFRIVLKNDGNIEMFASGWISDYLLPIPQAAKTNIVKVAAGYFHAGVVDNSGKVIIWGPNYPSDTGIKNVPVAAQSGVIDLSLGWGHAVALKANGEVITWGTLPTPQSLLEVPSEAQSNVVKITALEDGSMALLADGRIIIWGGQNQYGYRPVPTNNQPFSSIGVNSQNTIYAIASPRWTLTTSLNNANYGSVTPGGYKEENSFQQIEATPSSGYIFSGWTGDTSGSQNPVSVIMDSNKSIIANFAPDLFDNDSDGLTNFQEMVTYGSNLNQKDTNSDGIEDGQAVTLGYSPVFNFSALISYLQSHPPTGLYTSSQMQAMAVGEIVLTKNPDGSFILNYDIEKSSDLQSWLPYQSFALPLTNLPPDKAFIRLKAK